MKSRIFLSITALIFLTLFSCKKDDVNEPNLKLDGKTFSVFQGSVFGVSIEQEGHGGFVLFSMNGTEVITLTIDVESFTKETMEGKYSFPQQEGDKYLNEYLTNYSLTNMEEMTTTSLSEGTVSVKYNGGNSFTITMDLTMEDGKVFKGTYTGDFVGEFENV